MHKRTFELIAKWIGQETGIFIEFTDQPIQPQAQLETNTITIPINIKDDNALAALACLMHEAGHIHWSKKIPQLDITKGDKVNFLILNACEDIRIDHNVMGIMYNIKSFYKALVKTHVYPYAEQSKANLPFFVRALTAGSLLNNGFHGERFLKDDEIGYYNQNDITYRMNRIMWSIECDQWDEVKKGIAELRKIILPNEPKMPKEQPPPPQKGGQGDDESNDKAESQQGSGEGKGDEEQKQSSSGKAKGAGHGKGNAPDPGTEDSDDDDADPVDGPDDGDDQNSESADTQRQTNGSGQGSDPPPQSVVDQVAQMPEDLGDILKPKTVWEGGLGFEQMSGNETVAGLDLQEITKNRFREMMNVKIKSLIFDGKALNTQGLTNYFTGNVEELFVDDHILRNKKSKLYFLLDASGSMSSSLLDNQSRGNVVRKCMKTMQDIMDEIIEVEGVNVDYDVYGFTCSLQKLDKKQWHREYHPGGGTSIQYTFERLLEDHIQKEIEVDGRKIVVIITDGEVHAEEIRNMVQLVRTLDSTVRAMIIGVGADPGGQFVQRIIGDNNILAESFSDEIIMNAAIQMLE